jgi:hypothetical protein
MNYKKILNVVGVVAVAVVFCVGCVAKPDDDNENECVGCIVEPDDDNGNEVDSGISGSRISVYGAQVYEYDDGITSESKYTGSFSVDYWYHKLSDVFTNPVVDMRKGKLTINLGEPKDGLMSAKDAFDDDDVTTSDPTAKILLTGLFYCVEDCDPVFLALLNTDHSDEPPVFFVYADKPTILSGHDERPQCSTSINQKKGWNIVTEVHGDWYDNNEREGDYKRGCYILKNINADLSGSGAQKWIIYRGS